MNAKSLKTKHLQVKKQVIGCHPGCMDRRETADTACSQKAGSQESIL